MKLMACCSVAALLACGDPTAPEQAPDIAGRYEGTWRFTLLDSVLLVSQYGCGFAPCGPPQHREYVTITCTAALDMRLTGDRVQPFPNTSAFAWSGTITLGGCAEAYAPQPDGYTLPELLPPGLITVAQATVVDGWYQPEEVIGVAIRLQSLTDSYGELLGCTPGFSGNPPWHFGARLDELSGVWVLRGGIADGFGVPSFSCGEYVLFLESSFRMERVN